MRERMSTFGCERENGPIEMGPVSHWLPAGSCDQWSPADQRLPEV